MANIVLSDDGTLDTVLMCTDCSEEFRFNYTHAGLSDEVENETETSEEAYRQFVLSCIEEMQDEHQCMTV